MDGSSTIILIPSTPHWRQLTEAALKQHRLTYCADAIAALSELAEIESNGDCCPLLITTGRRPADLSVLLHEFDTFGGPQCLIFSDELVEQQQAAITDQGAVIVSEFNAEALASTAERLLAAQ